MEADAQVLQLEQALIRQAESLAREQRERADSGKARILNEASEKIRLAEEREVMSAKAEAEKIVRRHTQAAETRLAAELDRLRWALTESTLAGVKLAFQELVANDDARYPVVLEQWLAAAVRALPDGDLVAEVRGSDQPRLAPVWAGMVARAAPAERWNWPLTAGSARAASGCVLPTTGRNWTRPSRPGSPAWPTNWPGWPWNGCSPAPRTWVRWCMDDAGRWETGAGESGFPRFPPSTTHSR
jgi:V/A-type H+-transporting ATPase subunit E